jgi:hypothetical protein
VSRCRGVEVPRSRGPPTANSNCQFPTDNFQLTVQTDSSNWQFQLAIPTGNSNWQFQLAIPTDNYPATLAPHFFFLGHGSPALTLRLFPSAIVIMGDSVTRWEFLPRLVKQRATNGLNFNQTSHKPPTCLPQTTSFPRPFPPHKFHFCKVDQSSQLSFSSFTVADFGAKGAGNSN